MAKRVSLIILGWVLVIVGGAMTPLPPPFAFGIILLLTGLYLLVWQSKWMRRALQHLRHRYPETLGWLNRHKRPSSPALRKLLHWTHPRALIRWERIRLKRRGPWRRRRDPDAEETETDAVLHSDPAGSP